MGATAIYGFPYPEAATDAPNGPLQLQNLAEAIESSLEDTDDAVAAIETGYSQADVQATGFGTTTSTSYTSTLTGGTVAGKAFVAPPSGKVLILNKIYMFSSGTAGQYCAIRVRTGAVVGSGSDVLTANDDRASTLINTTTSGHSYSAPELVTGLTPGASYNVQQLVRVAGGTGSFNRHAVVIVAA